MSIPQPSGFFIKGVLNGAPHTLVIGPFGFLFGVVATEAGLSVFEALSFSVLVVAGAAQLTALELMQDNTPTVIVILSSLALNLRMALYLASMTPHLGTARFSFAGCGTQTAGLGFGGYVGPGTPNVVAETYEYNGILWTGSGDLFIGGSPSDQFGNQLTGSIMEFRLWNEPLKEQV